MRYQNNGYIETGLHTITADEFIDEFCVNGNRSKYKHAITNIFDFAIAKGAGRIIIGGSFLSTKENPYDLDCMLIFGKDINIPSFIDCAQMDNIEYDILYASEQTPELINAYIKLLSTDDFGNEESGVVEVRLKDKLHPWVMKYLPDDESMDIIHRIYSQRTFIERNKRRGLIVVIHGVNTNAQWLRNFVPACNKQGWIVAPFIYDNPATMLINPAARQKVVEDFREWIYEIDSKYQPGKINIVAHSFGTYITTKYIEGFKSEEFLPVEIESLILTGGIINPDYDWHQNIPCKVANVLNVVATGDDAVKFMPNTDLKKFFGVDKLCGRCAIDGFTKTSDKVVNRPLEILTHTNIFKDDFIEQIMLPYLNAHNGLGQREATQFICRR